MLTVILTSKTDVKTFIGIEPYVIRTTATHLVNLPKIPPPVQNKTVVNDTNVSEVAKSEEQ